MLIKVANESGESVEAAQETFDLLSKSTDKLIFTNEARNNNHTVATVYICIHKTDALFKDADFYLQLNDDGRNCVEDFKKILIKILGFQTVEIFGLSVKNEQHKKIKPLVHIYVPQVPYFNSEDEIFYDKHCKIQLSSKNNLNYVECRTKSNILPDLLKNCSLGFKGKNNKYFLKMENNFLLFGVNNNVKNSLLLESIFHLEAKEKLFNFFCGFENVLSGIRDALIYDFDNVIDTMFYRNLKALNPKNSKVVSFLYRLLCLCPDYRDHRKAYLMEIENYVFNKKSKGDFAGYIVNLSFNTEYLPANKEFVIDKIPLNSLKEFYYKNYEFSSKPTK